jgi:hypothetical protein
MEVENGSYAVAAAAASNVVASKNVASNRMLISGLNSIGGGGLVTTDIYEDGSYRKGPSMKTARFNHAIVTLPNKDVALFGGCNQRLQQEYLSSCEVFDSKKETFVEVGNMLERRTGCAAVLLPQNGLVMLIGGFDGQTFLNSCEFFDPVTRTFSECTASMNVRRHFHTASVLKNGKVLVCGGWTGKGNSGITSTEIYDPMTNCFTKGPKMLRRRNAHSATVLLDGTVLICGGYETESADTTEIYDPESNSFLVGPELNHARCSHFAALLSDGNVLVGGGCMSYETTEIYYPETGLFVSADNLAVPRDEVVASLF